MPTMGALHEGHLSLMRTAKRECGFCVASIFVNPTQFGPNEDFAKYPRQEERDFEMAEAAGVDAMFAPTVEEMYPDSVTTVSVSGVTDLWEGAHRPGHFDGVTTVVNKLLNIIRPTQAYFGWKDFQQCIVIGRMVDDLNLPMKLSFQETVREQDGLALSSRNKYLSPSDRALAPLLYSTLNSCRTQLLSGSSVESCIGDSRAFLETSGFDVQYLACVDPRSLLPLRESYHGARLIVAVRLGSTRLIDNIGL